MKLPTNNWFVITTFINIKKHTTRPSSDGEGKRKTWPPYITGLKQCVSLRAANIYTSNRLLHQGKEIKSQTPTWTCNKEKKKNKVQTSPHFSEQITERYNWSSHTGTSLVLTFGQENGTWHFYKNITKKAHWASGKRLNRIRLFIKGLFRIIFKYSRVVNNMWIR